MSSSSKAAICLRVIVVGGSIAGLSTAYALQNAGHNVTVLEQSDGRSRSPGPVRVPPNMKRILDEWGLDSKLAKVGLGTSGLVFRRGPTAELLSVIPFHAEILAELEATYMRIQHGDFQSLLLDHARREGVHVLYNCQVTSISFDPNTVTFLSDSGEEEILTADLIVGADGPSSLVKSLAFDDVDEYSQYSPYVYLAYTGSVDNIKNDPELREYLDQANDWAFWCGSGYVAYLDLGHFGTQYCISLALPQSGLSPEDLEEIGEKWRTGRPPLLEDFALDRDLFEPRLLKLIDMATKGITVGHQHREQLDSLIGDEGQVVLVGDAAHPMPPNIVHAASMAIEDAAILGKLFSRINQVDQISRLLEAYEDLRMPRTSMISNYELGRQMSLSLPDGPEQEGRDAAMKRIGAKQKSYDELDEESFNEQWGEEVQLYAYNAGEDAEDWFSKWGGFLTRA